MTLLAYRCEQHCDSLLPKIDQSDICDMDKECVSKITTEIPARDHDSTSSVSSKEDSIDASHFIEVMWFKLPVVF